MMNYEQYEEFSSNIKIEMIKRLKENLEERIQEYSLKNNSAFNINDVLTFVIPETVTFSVNYVDCIMKAILESSEQ